MVTQSRDHSGSYCHGMIEKVGNVLPSWLPGPAKADRPARESAGEKGQFSHVGS
jgi:hypothetical protein